MRLGYQETSVHLQRIHIILDFIIASALLKGVVSLIVQLFRQRRREDLRFGARICVVVHDGA